jgi:FAD/FMN-containing dehydrogenase
MSQLIKNGASVNEATTVTADAPVRAQLDPGLTGTTLFPRDPGWDEARTAWVVNVDQQPAAVALVRSVADVSAVVTSAARSGLTVIAQGTGHGALSVGSLSRTVLMRTTALNHVEVDPTERTARVGSGAEWQAVTAAAAEHGLAVQAGSAPDVGIAGFLLSGGISWLARSRGLAVNDVLGIEVVGADGTARIVDHDHEPDVFWALRGGGGGFGVVTAFELRLHPLPTVSAGTLFFPMPRAGEVLHAWRRWIRTVSNRTMSCGRLLQLPPLPEVPLHLRGRAFVALEVAHQGDVAELDATIAPLRDLRPVIDTITEIPTARLAELHMDPPGATPCRGNGMLLNDVPPPAIDALVACAGHGSGSPLLSVELRHLGGAVAQRPPYAGAVGHFDAEFVMYAVGITPDAATAAKVDAHVQLVERALGPWSASIHYANFDEHSDGGRDRFHDRATLERLQAAKSRVDPTGVFTCGHPITGPTALPPKSLVSVVPGDHTEMQDQRSAQ